MAPVQLEVDTKGRSSNPTVSPEGQLHAYYAVESPWRLQLKSAVTCMHVLTFLSRKLRTLVRGAENVRP